MKKKTYYDKAMLASAAMAMLLSACTTDDAADRQAAVPVMLTATVVEGSGEEATRAGTDIQATVLAAGEPVFVTLAGSDVTKATATYTSDGAGTLASSAPAYFTLTGTTTTIAAYHGKSGGKTGTQVNANTRQFTVAADQSTDADYQASDLMYATTTVTKGSYGALAFTHKMAKVIVNATAGPGISQIRGVYIVGGRAAITLSGDDCTLGTVSGASFSENSPLTMYSDDTGAGAVSCAALIPPQAVSNSNFLKVTTDCGDVLYSIDAKTFNTAQTYTLNVTVNDNATGTTVPIIGWTANGQPTVSPTVTSAVKAVDLGLSVKWANVNIGGNSETDFGMFFAWADVTGRPAGTPGPTKETAVTDGYNYDWAHSRFYVDGDVITFSKYTGSDYDILQPEDDAATAFWGSPWRMPTLEEMDELRNSSNCSWTWQDDYNGTGVPEFLVTSLKEGYTSNYIFLPAAGYRGGTVQDIGGTRGLYWTSTNAKGGQEHAAYYLNFWHQYTTHDENVMILYHGRFYGCRIRPVQDYE